MEFLSAYGSDSDDNDVAASKAVPKPAAVPAIKPLDPRALQSKLMRLLNFLIDFCLLGKLVYV